MTLEQILPGGGISIPIIVNNQIAKTEMVTVTEVDINLGSAFAADLGFPISINPYEQIEEEFEVILENAPSGSPTSKKKKKKSNKKKKKK